MLNIYVKYFCGCSKIGIFCTLFIHLPQNFWVAHQLMTSLQAIGAL